MSEAIPNCKLQHCSWYIVQNIKKRFAEKRYLVKERKIIMNLIQFYIQSFIKAELIKNRAILLAGIKAGEQNYIFKHQCIRKCQFVYYYIRKDPNLDYNST